MKNLKRLLSLATVALTLGCVKAPQPEPAYYRDSYKFRQSIEDFAKANTKTGNKITKEDIVAKFGQFDKETRTPINGKDSPVSVYYSQSEEYAGGKYTGKNNRDYFYTFAFEDGRLSYIFKRGLSYHIYTGDKVVKVKDRTNGPVEFGIERSDNPKWVSGTDEMLLTIKK
ncbi:MAG: hypothetical protein LBL52_00015 [Rickettsiales bacterium]|jgi:hypothetical protein|nr:hypothetical protein [Rickettsiales bacterium]